MKRALMVVLCIGLVFSIEAAQKKTVGWSTAYFVGWDYGLTPENMIWEGVTHVANFQAWPNTNGTISWPDEAMAKRLITEAHKRNKKVIISMGGGGAGQGLAWWCTNANRGRFISQIFAYVKRLGYDGVDTDWEDNIVDADYMAWHKDLRDSINRIDPKLCLTVAAEDWDLRTGRIHPYVDQINDMYYTATASNYPGFLKHFVDIGVPKSKIGAGIGGSPEQGSGNLGPQVCTDICNMVINQGFGGVMFWRIQNNGQVINDLKAVAPFVPVPTGIASNPRMSIETASVSFSVKSNLANGMTQLWYTIPPTTVGTDLNIGIYDLRGSLVKTLVRGATSAGMFSVPFPMAAGTYVAKMSTDNRVQFSTAFISR
jgi:hypothetical protein